MKKYNCSVRNIHFFERIYIPILIILSVFFICELNIHDDYYKISYVRTRVVSKPAPDSRTPEGSVYYDLYLRTDKEQLFKLTVTPETYFKAKLKDMLVFELSQNEIEPKFSKFLLFGFVRFILWVLLIIFIVEFLKAYFF